MDVDLTVVGLGYVGLPLAYEAAHAGLTVRGYDVSQATVHGLNRGVSHIGDLVDDDIAAMRRHGFTATTDSAALADSHTVVVCVPTPLAKRSEERRVGKECGAGREQGGREKRYKAE